MIFLPSREYFRDNVALRNDTLLGVCEAMGQDLGINPLWLRIPLAAGIMFSPLGMVVTYLALGVLVLVSRSFYPDRVQKSATRAQSVPATARNDDEMDLPRAA